MAPDSAAAKAGQVQASPARWSEVGQDEAAAWGECQGSGSSPYRTCVALADGVTRCSCPSRKFPCKHALGLLLLHADGTVPSGTAPNWVTEWLTSRATRAAASATRQQSDRPAGELQTAEPQTGEPQTGEPQTGEPHDQQTTDQPAARRTADPLAAARRAASREKKVDAGVEEMRRWLADLARGGLGAAQSQPWAWWDQQARRMIDAQARGLAGQVHRMAATAATAGQRLDWPERLTDQLGSAHLLCEAWSRRAALPERTAQALRVRLGFTVSADEVSTSGERVTDIWAVLGQRYSEDGNLRSLQQWLYGERTGAVVTFLAFAARSQPLAAGLPPGRRAQATVALYPGSQPTRVLITERQGRSEPLGSLPGLTDWDAAMESVADYLAVDPWADLLPVAVRGLTVLPARPAGPWRLRDAAGRAVPMAASPAASWALLAISGGRPVDVAGEWDGFAFTPQAAARSGQAGRLLP